MRSTDGRRRPARHEARTLFALTGITAALLLCGAPVPRTALAATRPDPVVAPIAHPDLDDAGSQIARYEDPRTGPRPRSLLDDLMPTTERVPGLDVSGHQGAVDWAGVADRGATFAYVKATEGTTFQNPFFAQQYDGAYTAGLLRGAYHFALPDRSSGAAQADFFVEHGGDWSADGATLPPALDIEYNPYGDICYGLTQQAMVTWIRDFTERVYSRTDRWPTIYTSTRWWTRCTGKGGDFSDSSPLWIARYGTSPGPMPFNWSTHTFWQFANAGQFPGDQDYFNGSYEQLRALALG